MISKDTLGLDLRVFWSCKYLTASFGGDDSWDYLDCPFDISQNLVPHLILYKVSAFNSQFDLKMRSARNCSH